MDAIEPDDWRVILGAAVALCVGLVFLDWWIFDCE